MVPKIPACRKSSPSANLALGGEAGQLGTGAGATGRAVVGLAGAEHEVLAIGLHPRFGRAEDFDVINEPAIVTPNLRGIEGLPHCGSELGQRGDIPLRDLGALTFNEEKPVSAPSDLAPYFAITRHLPPLLHLTSGRTGHSQW